MMTIAESRTNREGNFQTQQEITSKRHRNPSSKSVMPPWLSVHLRPRSVLLWLAVERLDRVCLHPNPHGSVHIDTVHVLLGYLARASHVHSEREDKISIHGQRSSRRLKRHT